MASALISSLFALAWVAPVSTQSSKDFPPGWNGEAMTPPMGWRSWNAFHANINQDTFVAAIDALTAKNRTVRGRAGSVSLCDLGYCSCGIDEGWEGCGQGINGTQHDAQGNPVINKDRFPDMASLVKYGHSKGLVMGWYENGCACGEHKEVEMNYEGDIKNLFSFGFDGVKLDGCGAQRNLTLYAELMKETGKSYLIENCHWGRCTSEDDSSCPTADWCPFNWYRTSGDINSGTTSWLENLQTTTRFQDFDAPLSRPGCWAYPDMLEVGRVDAPTTESFGSWNRAHFGAWCIVSAPLILGLELTDDKLEPILDVIGNQEAIAVNQQWAGHPGMLVDSYQPSVTGDDFVWGVSCDASDPTQVGWSLDAGTGYLKDGKGRCVTALDEYSGAALNLAKCDGNGTLKWTYDKGTKELKTTRDSKDVCLDLFYGQACGDAPRADLYACNGGKNQKWTVDTTNSTVYDSCNACLGSKGGAPPGTPSLANLVQLWAKPQPEGAVAILVINGGAKPLSKYEVDIKAKLNMTSSRASVRDIWAAKDLEAVTDGKLSLAPVAPYDSTFLLLTPEV